MEIKNHECFVSLEVAKLLKEAGFDWECVKNYMGEINLLWTATTPGNLNDNSEVHKGWKSAPTLEVAQKWLREVKKYHIILNHRTEMFFEERRYNLNEIKADIVNKYPGGGIYITSTAFYRSYEEALESGIKKTLEIILEKGE